MIFIMELSESEIKILCKFSDICVTSLHDHVSLRNLYSVTSKNYLWITIKSMEHKGIFNSYNEGRTKFIYLTSKGIKIVMALNTIRIQ